MNIDDIKSLGADALLSDDTLLFIFETDRKTDQVRRKHAVLDRATELDVNKQAAELIKAMEKDIASEGKESTKKSEQTDIEVCEITAGMDSKTLAAIVHDVEINGNRDWFRRWNINGTYSVWDENVHQYITQAAYKWQILFVNDAAYVYEDGVFVKDDSSGSRLKNIIAKYIDSEKLKASVLDQIYKLFVYDKWLKLPRGMDDLNAYPPEWIIFKNCIYDAKNRQVIEHDPKYRAINMIPWEYDPIRENTQTCYKIDQLLNEVMSPQDKQMFLEFAGYCMTNDTRQQKYMMFTGSGGTGKSTILNLLCATVGEENTAHVDLKNLSNKFDRFSKQDLIGKLLNACADISSTSLDDASDLKLLTGEDPIHTDVKFMDKVSFKNKAKLLFSANEIPHVKEFTDAMDRRLLVIRLNKKPAKVNVNLFGELVQEIPGFIHLCVKALGEMYDRGTIYTSPNSEKETHILRRNSDSIQAFLEDCCEIDPQKRVDAKTLYSKYHRYCLEDLGIDEVYIIKKQRFFENVHNKGFDHERNKHYVYGLRWKEQGFEDAGDSVKGVFTS